jgi:hypothetical protein
MSSHGAAATIVDPALPLVRADPFGKDCSLHPVKDRGAGVGVEDRREL